MENKNQEGFLRIVFWLDKVPKRKVKTKKKWQTEYRTATTNYPCLLPHLGEFIRSWSYRLADAKITIN